MQKYPTMEFQKNRRSSELKVDGRYGSTCRSISHGDTCNVKGHTLNIRPFQRIIFNSKTFNSFEDARTLFMELLLN